MKKLSVMLKPASSSCNLRCRYCFYAEEAANRDVENFGIMNKQTVTAVLKNIFADLERGDEFTFIFQGGEPAVAGLGWFEQFISEVSRRCPDGVKVFYSFQTNGTLLDDGWFEFFRENDFLVGISLDMYKELHDMCRIGPDGDGTYLKVLRAVRGLEKYGVRYNVLSVVTKSASRHADKVWNRIIGNKIRYIQFIPCLDGLSTYSGYAVSPEEMYEFYRIIFDRWVEAVDRNNYVSIKLFDDIMCLLQTNSCNACGVHGGCGRQVVVEADGSSFPCDFYMTDEYRIGSLKESKLKDLLFCDKAEKFRQGQPPEQCSLCRYCKFCGGGCKRMYGNMYFSGGKCYYAGLLDYILPQLDCVLNKFRRKMFNV